MHQNIRLILNFSEIYNSNKIDKSDLILFYIRSYFSFVAIQKKTVTIYFLSIESCNYIFSHLCNYWVYIYKDATHLLHICVWIRLSLNAITVSIVFFLFEPTRRVTRSLIEQRHDPYLCNIIYIYIYIYY